MVDPFALAVEFALMLSGGAVVVAGAVYVGVVGGGLYATYGVVFTIGTGTVPAGVFVGIVTLIGVTTGTGSLLTFNVGPDTGAVNAAAGGGGESCCGVAGHCASTCDHGIH